MLPSYNFICVPIDTRNPEITKNSFAVRIVSQLQFPMGIAQSPSTIRGALNQHPLLTRLPANPVNAVVWDFQHWTANGRSINPAVATKVVLRYTGANTLDVLLKHLLSYMGTPNGSVTPAKLGHNPSHEVLPEGHFVDVNKAADDLRYVTHSLKVSALRDLTTAIQIRAQSVKNQPPTVSSGTGLTQLSLETASFPLAKWVDGSMHASVLEVLAEKKCR